MIEVKFNEQDIKRIHELLEQIKPEKKDGAIRRATIKAAIYINGILKQNVAGLYLHIRTGNLARSIGMRVEQIDGQWQATIGSGQGEPGVRMIYADILETGGTIRPKNGMFLTIPLGKAMTPSGVARFTARDLKVNPSGFGYDSSVIVGGIIFGKNKGKRNMEPLFKLVTSVEIPAFRYMQQTAEYAVDDVADVYIEELERTLNS
jgi:hypothetical protein